MRRTFELLGCVALVAAAAGCASENAGPGDAEWSRTLDGPLGELRLEGPGAVQAFGFHTEAAYPPGYGGGGGPASNMYLAVSAHVDWDVGAPGEGRRTGTSGLFAFLQPEGKTWPACRSAADVDPELGDGLYMTCEVRSEQTSLVAFARSDVSAPAAGGTLRAEPEARLVALGPGDAPLPGFELVDVSALPTWGRSATSAAQVLEVPAGTEELAADGLDVRLAGVKPEDVLTVASVEAVATWAAGTAPAPEPYASVRLGDRFTESGLYWAVPLQRDEVYVSSIALPPLDPEVVEPGVWRLRMQARLWEPATVPVTVAWRLRVDVFGIGTEAPADVVVEVGPAE